MDLWGCALWGWGLYRTDIYGAGCSMGLTSMGLGALWGWVLYRAAIYGAAIYGAGLRSMGLGSMGLCALWGWVLYGSRPTLVGLSDIPGEAMVKLYCPKCMDVYTPKSSRHHHTDGAYFGTGFPHMLFMVHPEYRPKRPANQFVPRYLGGGCGAARV